MECYVLTGYIPNVTLVWISVTIEHDFQNSIFQYENDRTIARVYGRNRMVSYTVFLLYFINRDQPPFTVKIQSLALYLIIMLIDFTWAWLTTFLYDLIHGRDHSKTAQFLWTSGKMTLTLPLHNA